MGGTAVIISMSAQEQTSMTGVKTATKFLPAFLASYKALSAACNSPSQFSTPSVGIAATPYDLGRIRMSVCPFPLMPVRRLAARRSSFDGATRAPPGETVLLIRDAATPPLTDRPLFAVDLPLAGDEAPSGHVLVETLSPASPDSTLR